MKNMRKVLVLILVAPLLVMGYSAAHADAYDPLKTTVGNNGDNILQYVVEDGAVEINSYLAIMPPAVTSPSPSATPSTTPSAQALSAQVVQKSPVKATIVCIKGKTTKTVTGIKPVCPTGYKKK